VSTSRMWGTLSMRQGPSARRVAARMGSAAFLFPAGRIVPFSGRPPDTRNDGGMVTASYGAACARVKRTRTFALVNPVLALGLLAAAGAGAAFLVVALGAWLFARRAPSLAAAWTPRLPAVLGLAAVAAASGPGPVSAVARRVGVAPRLARALGRAAALETACAALAMSVPLGLRHPVSWPIFALGSGALVGLGF